MNRLSPMRVANDLSLMLDTVLGPERFPVDVESLAFERTKNLPDPITKIQAVEIDGFEGMLRPSKKKPAWHILYNTNTPYPGRERFTLAHEFGHYLLHRTPIPLAPAANGTWQSAPFMCNPLERNQWNPEDRVREDEADTFASYLLMPINDFRNQVSGQTPDLGLFKRITTRYGVSLTAAMSKWIEFTARPAALVVGRDEFAIWGRASSSAYKMGVYVPSGMPLPTASLAYQKIDNGGVLHLCDSPIWAFKNGTTASHELSVFSSRTDKSLTLLLFEANGADHEEPTSFDSLDFMNSQNRAT